MITVVVVDDHPIVRAGMSAVLEKAPDITVVGAVGTGAAALAAVEAHHPDVLVLDVNLPDTHGADVAAAVKPGAGAPGVLVLTMHADEATIFDLLDAGVLGYVVKEDAVASLAHAVRAVAAGRMWLSPQIAHRVVRRALAGGAGAATTADQAAEGAPPRNAAAPHDTLTPRERQVLELIAAGLDNGTIADHLGIVKRTVQNHVSNVYTKLRVTTRAEALLYALRHGIVTAPTESTGA